MGRGRQLLPRCGHERRTTAAGPRRFPRLISIPTIPSRRCGTRIRSLSGTPGWHRRPGTSQRWFRPRPALPRAGAGTAARMARPAAVRPLVVRQAAAQQAGCTQVVRASYLSVQAKVMGTIGVLNLKSFAAASQAGKATGPASYIAQLTTKHGLTHQLGGGTGIEEALVKGHYLILVWAQFTSLRAPKTPAETASLKAFMTLLIQQTANVSLSYRMVDGTPPPPAG